MHHDLTTTICFHTQVLGHYRVMCLQRNNNASYSSYSKASCSSNNNCLAAQPKARSTSAWSTAGSRPKIISGTCARHCTSTSPTSTSTSCTSCTTTTALDTIVWPCDASGAIHSRVKASLHKAPPAATPAATCQPATGQHCNACPATSTTATVFIHAFTVTCPQPCCCGCDCRAASCSSSTHA